MQKALHGDTVELYVYNRKKNGKQEGEITQIIERCTNRICWIVQLNEKFAFVVPDSNKMPVDVFVPLI